LDKKHNNHVIFSYNLLSGSKSKGQSVSGIFPLNSSSGVPIRRFGKGNNFHQFKQALSEVSSKDFGNLGKLILKGSYFIPEYEAPKLPENVTTAIHNALTLESMKEHQKAVEKMKADRPKLFGLIMQHLSSESKDELRESPEYEEWFAESDPEKLW
jgi:hypothetical protein